MKLSNVKSNAKVYGLQDILFFGKHKGENISEVIEKDPNWLFWAVEENIIQLDNASYKTLEERGPEQETPEYLPDWGDQF